MRYWPIGKQQFPALKTAFIRPLARTNSSLLDKCLRGVKMAARSVTNRLWPHHTCSLFWYLEVHKCCTVSQYYIIHTNVSTHSRQFSHNVYCKGSFQAVTPPGTSLSLITSCSTPLGHGPSINQTIFACLADLQFEQNG